MLFPEKCKDLVYNSTIIDYTPSAKHTEDNIQRMCSEIDSNKLVGIHEETRTLVNGQVATPKQTADMLSLREIEVQVFKQYDETRMIQKSSSANAPLRHQKL